ncbi:LacI family DNA-binding transcriptional regulator [Actinoplanes sp. NPDC048967]|uniref:LacI family DNA-binding transcriptional regulator n=1 Tax=Actinoplanes sp. NPDC048967 TaxID=3155269 RepID=UPI0033F2D59C
MTRRRVTQQDIARMTGVSQATVSLVLNGRDDADVRIAPETRERVLQAIRSTGYVADPIARRLAARHNRILGVFTYESVFPAGLGDFYHPFLAGIEECAERVGCDLLLLTSAPVIDGRRRIFHQDNRLRLADGCVLLGRSLDPAELARLLAEGQPFVSVGRRDDAGGPVPYVGADYPGATAAQVRAAVALGHRRLAYVGEGAGPESHADRLRGFTAAVTETGVNGRHLTIAGSSPAVIQTDVDGRRQAVTGSLPAVAQADADDWRQAVAGSLPAVAQADAEGRRQAVAGVSAAAVLDAILTDGRTCVFVEEFADGVVLAQLAAERGLRVPGDLSFVALGDPTRPAATDIDFTGYRIPRREMGWQAVEVLAAMLEGTTAVTQRILPCEPVAGATLAAVAHA